MLLLIDAGNTRVKWALAAAHAQAGDWLAHGACLHAELADAAQRWPRAQITHALVANVAGATLRAQLGALLGSIATEWFAASRERAGVVNGYRVPERLGCDRFAAAIGARTLVPDQALVVATCGTATTIDALSADGHFIGGMILPGLSLMLSALARNTAQLPQIQPGSTAPPQFADNTDEAILSGCLSAQSGAIERAISGHGGALCLLSGGAAPAIAPALTLPHQLVDNIVLVGLHAVALAAAPTQGAPL